ncbi:MAG: hypothetical protein ACOYMH_18580 [Zwartia sp.]
MTTFFTWKWIGSYLATGIVVIYLTRMLTLWLNRTRTGQPWWVEIHAVFRPEKQFQWKDEFITLLICCLFSVAWPVILVWIPISLCSSSANWRSRLPSASFKCQPAHLRKAITPFVAETLGTVIDPLNRAPSLPFGHLNAGWLAFLGMEAEGFALWYFEVPCAPIATSESTQTVLLNQRGLAWVKSRKVKAEFVFEGN